MYSLNLVRKQATMLCNYNSFCELSLQRDSLSLSRTSSLHMHSASTWCHKLIPSFPLELDRSQSPRRQCMYSSDWFALMGYSWEILSLFHNYMQLLTWYLNLARRPIPSWRSRRVSHIALSSGSTNILANRLILCSLLYNFTTVIVVYKLMVWHLHANLRLKIYRMHLLHYIEPQRK